MYKVIVGFIDLQDNNYPYKEGDKFPHSDKVGVLPSRYEELASNRNRRGIPLIKEVKRSKKTEE